MSEAETIQKLNQVLEIFKYINTILDRMEENMIAKEKEMKVAQVLMK